MFPSPSRPVSGIFVKEQIENLSEVLDFQYDLHLIDGLNKGKTEYLKSMFEIPGKIRNGNYDLIHIHYGLSALFLLLFRPESKVFLTLHGSDILKEGGNKWQVFLTKKILPRVDKVFILNEKMKDIVSPLNSEWEMLPCGVNTDFFFPSANKLPKNPKKKLIVFPNSPSRAVKNYPLFEKTIQYLNRAGQFDYEFRCIENLSRSQVKDLLNEADCLLMTSKSEGSPQVVKEALACGTPVVTVPVGDVRPMLKDVPHCFVANAMEDPKELGELVKKVIWEEVDNQAIRDVFISKRKYDHKSIAYRIAGNYQMGNSKANTSIIS